jgi:hypothetical protein
MNPTLLGAVRRSIATPEITNEHSLTAARPDCGRKSGLSRRQFVGSTAGALAAAAVGGAGWRTLLAQTPGSSSPLPIPGGSPVLGGAFHVFAPAAFDPIDAEPATITNFNGFVGLSYTNGMVTRSQRSTGAVVQLPFLGADMRFMQGVYRGADGGVRRGTFGFI